MSENSEGPKPSLKDTLNQQSNIISAEKQKLADTMNAEKKKIADVIATKKVEEMGKKEEGRIDDFGKLNEETENLVKESDLSEKNKEEVDQDYEVKDESVSDYKKSLKTVKKLYNEAKENSGEVLENMDIKTKKDFVEKLGYTEEIEEALKLKNESREKYDESVKKIQDKKKELTGEKKTSKEKVMEILNEKVKENDRKIAENEAKKVDLVVEQVMDWTEMDGEIKKEMDSLKDYVQKQVDGNDDEKNINEFSFNKTYGLIKEKFGEEMVEKSFDKLVSKMIESNLETGVVLGVGRVDKVIKKIQLGLVNREMNEMKDARDKVFFSFELEQESRRWSDLIFDKNKKGDKLSIDNDHLILQLDELTNDGGMPLKWKEIPIENPSYPVDSRMFIVKRIGETSKGMKIFDEKVKSSEEKLIQLNKLDPTFLTRRYEVDGKKLNKKEMEKLKIETFAVIQQDKKVGHELDEEQLSLVTKGMSKDRCLDLLGAKLAEIKRNDIQLWERMLMNYKSDENGKILLISNEGLIQDINDYYSRKIEAGKQIVNKYESLEKKGKELRDNILDRSNNK